MKRIDAMFPDSIQPKYQMALHSLYFSVMNPHAEQTERLLAEAGQTITQMETMKNADQSDLCTLRGFLYMVRIVQDPAQNGQRYYIDVMQNFEKALKLNPDNQLASQLQEKFFEGMQAPVVWKVFILGNHLRRESNSIAIVKNNHSQKQDANQ